MKHLVSRSLPRIRLALTGLAVFQLTLGVPFATALQAHEHGETRSPIKHVIVLIGENRTFDHLFATYVPKSGNSVKNLLSERIVNIDGTPGPFFHKAPSSRRAHQGRDRLLRSSSSSATGTCDPSPGAAGT